MVSQWSLSESESPLVSRTLLSVLADLNNSVVWMVSTRPLISKSSSPVINNLETVPRAPIRIGVIVTFMFIQFSSEVEVFILFFHFLAILLSDQLVQQSPQFGKISFLLIIIRSGYLAENRWSVCMSKSKLRVVLLMLGCVYNICSYGQTSVSYSVPSGSLYLYCSVLSYILFVLICCISLLCDSWFRFFCSAMSGGP